MANAVILGISYPHGSAPTSITDNNGNTWPAVTVTADEGTGNYVAAIYVLFSPIAALTTLTVGFAATVLPFQYTLTEVANVGSVDVSAGTAGVTGPSLATGSMTTTANGDFIWAYYALAATASNNPSSWVPASGFTLLDGDIAWSDKKGFPHASQWMVQGSAGAINPGITATGDTTDLYNCVAVALKASGGTPKVIQHIASSCNPVGISGTSGKNFKIPIQNALGGVGYVPGSGNMYVNKVIHMTADLPPTGSWILQIPSVGNLRVLANAQSPNQIDITSVSDSESGTWTIENGGVDQPQIIWRGNTSANPNLTVTLSITGTPSTVSWRYYDISGAAASPHDVTAGVATTGANSVTSVSDQPVITPTVSGGLVIASLNIGQGPGLAVTSPAEAQWDLCTYPPDELDVDLMENADGGAFLYNAPASALHWNWTITSQPSNSVTSTAVAFKAAPATGPSGSGGMQAPSFSAMRGDGFMGW